MIFKAYTELGSIYVMAKMKFYVGSSVGVESLWYEDVCMLLLLLVCTATWCIVWNIFIFIFGQWVVRRVLFLPLALLFLVLLIFFCICAKYCFLIVSCFEFLLVLRFFCTYGRIWFRIYFSVRERGILCRVWWRARCEWAVGIMERIFYFWRNTRIFWSRIFFCYVYVTSNRKNNRHL